MYQIGHEVQMLLFLIIFYRSHVFNLVMKYRNDLIGKKILIICNSIGSSYKRLYCSYVLGKIIEYNPATNKIMVIRNLKLIIMILLNIHIILIIGSQQENQKMIMKHGGM